MLCGGGRCHYILAGVARDVNTVVVIHINTITRIDVRAKEKITACCSERMVSNSYIIISRIRLFSTASLQSPELTEKITRNVLSFPNSRASRATIARLAALTTRTSQDVSKQARLASHPRHIAQTETLPSSLHRSCSLARRTVHLSSRSAFGQPRNRDGA